jgi:hypothetical protein
MSKVRFKKGDRIVATDISDKEWKVQYGSLPKDTIMTVSHLSARTGNCVHPYLPEHWEYYTCNNHQKDFGDPHEKPFGYGFYCSQYELVKETYLPEDLFTL